MLARPERPQARAVVAAVLDPEVPVLTIDDLGILRDVARRRAGRVDVTITPTYSGCPAMDAIRADVTARSREHGYDDVEVALVLSPAWTTDWMSDAGKRSCSTTASRRRSRAVTGPVAVTLDVCGARSAARPTPASSAGSARPRASRCGCATPARSRSTTSRRTDHREPRDLLTRDSVSPHPDV